MMKHFNKFFKRKVHKKKREVKFDVSDCEFLQMSKQEQEDTLISDGHYIRSKRFVYNSDKAPDDFVPEQYKNSSLPLEVDMSFKFEIDFKNLTEVFEPTEKVVVETFEHFEIILKNIIEAFVFSEKSKLNKHLSSIEESSRKLVIHKFFIGSFQTFDKDELFFINNYQFLPLGVEKTNLLSKTYLVERYIKRTLLAEDIDLIKMYLYCPNLLNSKTIHIDFPNLSWLVDFCARRNLMIELNETYDFEQSHPYTFIHSNKLTHHYHSNLIVSEIDFDWMIKILIERKNVPNKKEGLTNTFCSRLTKVLKDEDCFKSGTTNAQFCTFLQSNFNTSFKKLRPDEALDTSPGKQEVEELLESLITYRNSKN